MTRRSLALLALLLAQGAGAQERGWIWLSKPAPACSEGAVSAKCKCGGAKVTSGYCCSGVAQSYLCGLLLSEPAGTVAHLYFDASGIHDTRAATTYTQAGTVPLVAASAPLPAGAGPFSAANYWYTPNSSAWNAAGDFYIVVIYLPTNMTGGPYLIGNGDYAVSGYLVQDNTVLYLSRAGSVSTAGATNNPAGVSAKVNVICYGADAGKASLKLNNGTFRQGTAITQLANSTTFTGIGKRPLAAANYLNGTMYEALYVAGTPTDLVCGAYMTAVKSAIGASAAW